MSRSPINSNLNRALIVFQFTATIVLVIGTITVSNQLSFIRNRELGLNLEQTLIVKGPAVKDSTYHATLSSFRNEAKNLSGVSSFAVTSSIPGEELKWGRSFARRDNLESSIGSYIVAIDENFFTLFDAHFVAGKNYPDASNKWKDAIIINESAAKQFGYQDASLAIGQTILWNENERQLPKEVIGVIRDFNQQSLHNKVEPIIFTLKEFVFAPWAGEFYAFKIQSSDLNASIEEIEGLWKRMFHQNPFDYFFLDDYFNAQYKNDEQLGRVFTAFSVLAIFIASLGLFGLTAYMTAMRTKEIGVRKVLGSSSFQLVKLLSSQYLKLVVIAFVIACPIAKYLMKEWLSQFTYQISLGLWIFISAGLICFVTAMLTVGLKSWQSANLDPAKALKYE
jgi:putative ABC transport system permease protein